MELVPFKQEGNLQTFEKFFAETVNSHLGRLVALGNPTNRVLPKGAARLFFSDEEWRRAVEKLTEASCCILASSVGSKNVVWELKHIRSVGHHTKLFILTPPQAPSYDRIWNFPSNWRGAAMVCLVYATLLLYRGDFTRLADTVIRGAPVPSPREEAWSDMAATLRAAGYKVNSDPGPGAVLAFDNSGAGIVLKQEAVEPLEFIEPLKRHLKKSFAS